MFVMGFDQSVSAIEMIIFGFIAFNILLSGSYIIRRSTGKTAIVRNK